MQSGFTTLVVNAHDVHENDRTSWRVVMSRGFAISGTLLDPDGVPVPDTDVEAVYEDPGRRRSARSDADGRFRITALSPGPLRVRALVVARDLEASRSLHLATDVPALELRAAPMVVRDGERAVIGLRLKETTASMRKELGLPDTARVAITDPGANSTRLGIGTLRAGYGVWMIGKSAVRSIKHLVESVLSEHALATKRNPQFPMVRVVYVYGGSSGKSGWTNTQHMFLSEGDLASLRRTAEALR